MLPVLALALALVSIAAPPRLRVASRVESGTQPKSVSVSPDGGSVAVCNFGQASTRNVVLLAPDDLSERAAVDFDGTATKSTWLDRSTLLVSDFANGRLMKIDASAGVVSDTIDVGPNPKGIALDTTGTMAFVTNWSGRSVSVVDLVAGQTVQTIDTGRRPRGVALLRDGTLVVGAMWDHRVELFGPHHEGDGDPSRWSSDPTTRRICSYVRDVKTSPDRERVIVSCSSNRMVRWLDPWTRKVVGQAFVGKNPRSLSIAADGTWAAVANFHGASVSVIDLEHGQSTETPLPRVDGVVGGAVHPGPGMVVFATSWATGEVLRLVPERRIERRDPLGQRRLRKHDPDET